MSLQQCKIYYGQGQYVEHYFLCNYRPVHAGGDRLSRSLLRFKDGLSFDLQAWIDCAVAELKKVNWNPGTVILRAIGSHETSVNSAGETALDQLGKAIAREFMLTWNPSVLIKARNTRPLKLLSAEERWTELDNAYRFSSNDSYLNDKPVLVIDDIVTTGATVISITKLFKENFPGSRVKVFTLAKSAYDSSLNTSLHLSGAAYNWEEHAGWMVAEEEADISNYSKLITHILKDDFSEE